MLSAKSEAPHLYTSRGSACEKKIERFEQVLFLSGNLQGSLCTPFWVLHIHAAIHQILCHQLEPAVDNDWIKFQLWKNLLGQVLRNHFHYFSFHIFEVVVPAVLAFSHVYNILQEECY